jgi:hypothetical protein
MKKLTAEEKKLARLKKAIHAEKLEIAQRGKRHFRHVDRMVRAAARTKRGTDRIFDFTFNAKTPRPCKITVRACGIQQALAKANKAFFATNNT